MTFSATGYCCPQVRWLGARVLAALAHLHSRGLVHRDISSHNIYRSASGHPLLADFGERLCNFSNEGGVGRMGSAVRC